MRQHVDDVGVAQPCGAWSVRFGNYFDQLQNASIDPLTARNPSP